MLNFLFFAFYIELKSLLLGNQPTVPIYVVHYRVGILQACKRTLTSILTLLLLDKWLLDYSEILRMVDLFRTALIHMREPFLF